LGDVSILEPVSEVLGTIRRAKTEAKLSQRAGVEELIVDGPANALAAIEACRDDLAEAGGIETFTLSPGDDLLTAVRLAPSTEVKTAN
jgi:valyl-tRNA synthetase